MLQRRPAIAQRHPARIERVADAPHRKRRRGDDHAHFGQDAVPRDACPSAGEASRGIAGDRRGAPEPFFQEMVGQVLQPRLDAPIIFADHEHERVGGADLRRQRLERGRRGARGIFLVHPVEHRQIDRPGVDQLGHGAPRGERPHEIRRQPDPLAIRAVGAVEDQDMVAHAVFLAEPQEPGHTVPRPATSAAQCGAGGVVRNGVPSCVVTMAMSVSSQ